MKIVKISGLTGTGKSSVLEALSKLYSVPVLEAATFRRELESGNCLQPIASTVLIDEVQHAGCGVTHLLVLLGAVWGDEQTKNLHVFYTTEEHA